MSEPFLAEIRMVGFDYPPRGWAFCDGQMLPINQNQSLYSLLGTTYGGDGRETFALPDLRGRTPIHTGSSNGGDEHREGDHGGEEAHTLTTAEMPGHRHGARGTNADADQQAPEGHLLANNLSQPYTDSGQPETMSSGTVADTGGGQGHNNMQPFLALNFCIALQGLFPSRN